MQVVKDIKAYVRSHAKHGYTLTDKDVQIKLSKKWTTDERRVEHAANKKVADGM